MNQLLTEDEEVIKTISHYSSTNFDESLLEIPPFSKNYEDIFVPKRFSDAVVCHVIAPYLEGNTYYKPPIYLAIKGAPGEGKTAQAIATCTQRGIYVLYVSASTLSGSHENEAKEKLQKIYNHALQVRKKALTTIVIDDFHKGIVNEDENIKRTINTDILIGYMMNIAEYNGIVHIPIILTANDLSKVYAPLLRTGRADVFFWEPKPEEKREIVFKILYPFIPTENDKEFDKFYKKFQCKNVAFFSQLKNQWRKKVLKEAIQHTTTYDEVTLGRINHFVNSFEKKLSYAELTNIAESLIAERGD